MGSSRNSTSERKNLFDVARSGRRGRPFLSFPKVCHGVLALTGWTSPSAVFSVLDYLGSYMFFPARPVMRDEQPGVRRQNVYSIGKYK
jgi:hypothetical protein